MRGKDCKDCDVVVIGAGVVGLATAQTLANAGQKVLVIEREAEIGTGTSSRNSGIIHSGIYYEPGSLRAKLCVSGKHLLYDYCQKNKVRHNRIGKLLVAANEEEVGHLKEYLKIGAKNRVELKAFLKDAIAKGATLMLNTKTIGGNVSGDQKEIVLEDTKSGKRRTVGTRFVVNAAGLYAQEVAESIGESRSNIPRRYLAKGNYFELTGKAPFSHLIYPMPNAAGLGTHLTIGLDNEAKFGPDVDYIEEIEYSVNNCREETFYKAIREYWPDLPDGSLKPSFCGIRPKLHGPGTKQGDFQIDFQSTPGVIHLYGIESPGLTSSMAIGQLVKEKLLRQGDLISSKM